MDSKVETKTPSNRRTKYVIIGLLAVVCVLSYQLYSENKAKKQLVHRKSFYISKLYECRASSEKTETKYQEKRTTNEKLTKDLSDKTDEYDKIFKKYSDLEDSYQSQTDELSKLQKSAEESKNDLSTLKENYETAMSSVKTMQGKLDETIKICEQHKEKTESLSSNASDLTQKLETCQREKAMLQQEKQGLVQSEQNLRKKIEEMGSSAHVSEGAAVSNAQQAAETRVVQQDPSIEGKVQQIDTSYIHQQPVQNSVVPGQSSQNSFAPESSQTADQYKMTQQAASQTPVSQARATPSFKQPIATATDTTKKTSLIDDELMHTNE